MSTTDWIISIAGVLISILLGICSYFIVKWIQSVDETLKEQSKDIKDNTLKIISLESKQDSQAENNAKAIQAQLSTVKFPHSKIDEVKQEVSSIKETIQKKILPQLERQTEDFGKVVVVESQLREQDKKLIVLFKVLQRLVQDRQGP
jgi:hypothetical protein